MLRSRGYLEEVVDSSAAIDVRLNVTKWLAGVIMARDIMRIVRNVFNPFTRGGEI